MSTYLKLARRAAARAEHQKTNAKPKQKEAPAPQPANHACAPACVPSEPEEKPDPPVPKRDQSDISDQSPDYRVVVKMLEAPPYWLRDSYMSGYRKGTIILHVLSAAVAATLGRSAYKWTERLTPLVEQALKKEVT